ncbi:MAG: hypothetical protein AAF708_21565 [Deinococcota bacterium]
MMFRYALLTLTALLLSSSFASVETFKFAEIFEPDTTKNSFSAQVTRPMFGSTPIPFEVTSDFDMASLDYVSTGPTWVNAAATGYVDAPLRRDGAIALNTIVLYDEQDRIVALDVLRPTLRENLVFSHENTARSQIMSAHPLLQTRSRNILNDPDDEVWIRIYNAVDAHPRFDDYVTFIRDLGYIPFQFQDPNHDAYYQFAYDIAIDLVQEFLSRDGSPKSP